ncbi:MULTISPECIES: DUF6415 family natural product biosynthesis protein [unclassified Streptomyces]|uniref:DUF6415 family natural product biosynthesis protein n=1 Tax=unclassified Streptomyces TaxID=2593676 RepID=UPI002365DFF9|nr:MULTISPECIES: DUF6415 family natural product biosynthesis protein [unclassified Streptomyces]MDF3141080.1 DUF6415 family natural product biosynthesis protein [Streptomyces sp. T21Q-yed]WDF45065.1 DUF6415 family natural product biosynthesis protein [Streptomyces sp. T12]
MTAPAEVPAWTHPVRAAVLPFDADRLRWVLNKVQTWKPYIDGSLLDDLAAVLDDYTPSEDEIGESAMRLRGHLMRLVNLAVTANVVDQDKQVGELVEKARAVRSQDLPADPLKAVGYVRQMGWTLDALLERLVANQCLKEES